MRQQDDIHIMLEGKQGNIRLEIIEVAKRRDAYFKADIYLITFGLAESLPCFRKSVARFPFMIF